MEAHPQAAGNNILGTIPGTILVIGNVTVTTALLPMVDDKPAEAALALVYTS